MRIQIDLKEVLCGKYIKIQKTGWNSRIKSQKVFWGHGGKTAVFAVDVPLASLPTLGAAVPKLGAFQPSLNPGGAVYTQGSVPQSFNQTAQNIPTAIQLIIDNKFNTNQYLYKSENGIDTYTANDQFVFTEAYEGGQLVWTSGGGPAGKQMIVNTMAAGADRYRMVYPYATSASTEGEDFKMGARPAVPLFQQPLASSGGTQVALPQLGQAQPQLPQLGQVQPQLPQLGQAQTASLAPDRRLAVTSFTAPGQVFTQDRLGPSHQNFHANLHFVTTTNGVMNVDDTSQYSIYVGQDGYIYNFADQAQCVEVKFVNNTIWKMGEMQDFPTNVEFSITAPPHVLIATKNQTYTYRLVNRKWQLGSHITNVKSQMDPSNVKIEIGTDATCAQTLTDETKYSIKTFDELNIFYYEFYPDVFCAGVIYQNQYLWKYAANFGNYYPKRIYFHKDVMMVVVDFVSFYLVYKFDNMWKFDSQVIKDFHDDQLELVTYDSQNNTANVNDASQYRVIEHYYLRQYKFVPGSMCISLRYQQKPVWARRNDFQSHFPKSIVYNIKTKNFFVDFDPNWYYVYVFDQQADKWYLVHKDETNKPANIPPVQTDEETSQNNPPQDLNALQSRTVDFGDKNQPDPNRLVDLSKMGQPNPPLDSDIEEGRVRRNRAGMKTTSVIKQVSLSDGSAMEVEEVMSEAEDAGRRRRRKAEGQQAVAPPIQTDNEGAMLRTARAKTTAPLETDVEIVHGRSPRSSPTAGPKSVSIPLDSDVEEGGSRQKLKTLASVKQVALPDGSAMEVEEVMSEAEYGGRRRRKSEGPKAVSVPLETDNEGGAPAAMPRAKAAIPLETDNEGGAPRVMPRARAANPLETDNEGGAPAAIPRAKSAIPLETDNEGGAPAAIPRAKSAIPLETDNEGAAPRVMARPRAAHPLETDNEGGAPAAIPRAKSAIPLETDNEGAAPRVMARPRAAHPLETDNEGGAPPMIARAKAAIPLDTDTEGHAPRAPRTTAIPLDTDTEAGAPRSVGGPRPLSVPIGTDSEGAPVKKDVTAIPLDSDREGHIPRAARGPQPAGIPLDSGPEGAGQRRTSVLSIPLQSEGEGDAHRHAAGPQQQGADFYVSDSRPFTGPQPAHSPTQASGTDFEIKDPGVPKTVVMAPHVQDVALSSFSEDESHRRIDDNLIILDVNNRRGTDIVKHRFDHRRNANIFTARKPYLFYMVKQGMDTVWFSKDGNYPDQVVVKTDKYGESKFRVYFPQHDPRAPQAQRKAKYAESFDSDLDQARFRDPRTHDKHHRGHTRAERHRPADRHYHKSRDRYQHKHQDTYHERYDRFDDRYHDGYDMPQDRHRHHRSHEPSKYGFREPWEPRESMEPRTHRREEPPAEFYDPSQPFKIQYDYDQGKVAGVRCNGSTIWRRQPDDPYPQSAKFYSDILMISLVFNRNHFHIYKFNGYKWKRIRASVERIAELDVFKKGSTDSFLFSRKNNVDTYMAMDRFLFNKVKISYANKYRCMSTDIWSTDNPTNYADRVVVNRFSKISTDTEVTIHFINGCEVTYLSTMILRPFAKVRWSETTSEIADVIEIITMDEFGNYELNNNNKFDIYAHWKVEKPGSNLRGIYKYVVVFYQNARCVKVRHRNRKLWNVDPQLSGNHPTKITFNLETNKYFFEFSDDVYNFVIEDKTPSYY
ncbi:conserved hypothetical protein [Theileria orientalis strain Shintoku]|uniref:Uncharacterized protein n=1 Tax=Theileria orientalis strain Shintoku TaxID=869250 RepID=J4C3N5_THEOR|nr:conserved hypothetical protein [Theileria orientalis strain Shintoku]BAM40751.1 conserved hypothetical protein [Theileria orientalis strain Shintoku]|eukprot:XP_009691052.1 conserved hypothetical protein [Theileria orientalis strain Shintoku]